MPQVSACPYTELLIFVRSEPQVRGGDGGEGGQG